MPAILTPDQRVRVFVSSTLEELAEERAAAKRAIESLHLTPVLFELGARPHPPQELYRAYLEQSHVFVAIYWQRYGWIAPGMDISGLEDELRLAGDRPKLVYLKRPAPDREPRLEQLLDVVRDSGVSYRAFTTPEELAELVARDVATLLGERFQTTGATEPSPVRPPARAGLPVATTSFVGRAAEVEDVLEALHRHDVRLVSLVGPGGIGKTRLALEVARRGEAEGGGEVVFVPLESVGDPAAVGQAIVRAVGIDERGTEDPLAVLCGYFADRRALLVLDNFEHLLDGAATVADLLRGTADLTILVTTREPLRLRGEHEVLVPSLTPDEAVQLFADRARRGDQAVAEADRAVVEAICERLDHVPLAIELAAARTRLLAPSDILRRLGDRLDFLVAGPRDVPERQQTLRSTIAWSYDLLEPDQQRAFAALGVFSGPFSEAAVAAVAQLDDPLEVLASLVDKSLLLVEPPGDEVRVRMLGTVRDFALEQLAERGELDGCRARHAAHFHALAVAASGPLRTRQQSAWLDRLDADAANLRSGLEWWIEQRRFDELGQVVWYLWVFAWLRGYLREVRELLDRVLADPALTGPARTRVVATAGILEVYGGGTRGVALLSEAVERARAEGAEDVLAAANMQLAVAGGPGDMDEALRLFRKVGDHWGAAATLCAKAWVHVNLDQFEGADAVFDEAEAAVEHLGDDFVVAMILANVAERRSHEGDLDAAVDLLSASVARYQRLRAAYPASFAVEAAAQLAVRRGRFVDAASLLAGAEAMRASIEAIWTPAQERHDRLVALVGEELDPDELRAAWVAAEDLDYAAVLDLVRRTLDA